MGSGAGKGVACGCMSAGGGGGVGMDGGGGMGGRVGMVLEKQGWHFCNLVVVIYVVHSKIITKNRM